MRTLTVITGPSGSGKTTLAKLMVDQYNYTRVITTTSRPPREGEQDGVDYHFVSKGDFNEALMAKEFVEAAVYDGNYYGITYAALNAAAAVTGRAVAVCEIEGYLALRDRFNEQLAPEIIEAWRAGTLPVVSDHVDLSISGIFLDNSVEELMRRLKARGDKDVDSRFDLLRRDRQDIAHFLGHRDGTRSLYAPTMKQLRTFLDSYIPYNKMPRLLRLQEWKDKVERRGS